MNVIEPNNTVALGLWGKSGKLDAVMQTQSPDTSLDAEKVLIELIRKTPLWRRLQLADQMSRTARELAMAGLRLRHPNASHAELRRRFADLHLGPRLAAEAYGPLP